MGDELVQNSQQYNRTKGCIPLETFFSKTMVVKLILLNGICNKFTNYNECYGC